MYPKPIAVYEGKTCRLNLNTLHPGKFSPLLCHLIFFSKSAFLKNSFRNIMSNSLDPDQAGHSVGPYLGPDCLQSYQQTVLGDRVNYNTADDVKRGNLIISK